MLGFLRKRWKIFLTLSLLSLGGWFIYWSVFLPPSWKGEKTILIPSGADSLYITSLLAQEKIVRNKVLFLSLLRLLGKERSLKAGEYTFTPSSMFSVIRKLKLGEIKTYPVTIPEGLPRWEVAKILEEKGIVEKEKFLQVVENPSLFKEKFSFLSSFQSLKTLEGYLYPDTYYFQRGEPPFKVVKKFLSRFREEILPLYEKAEKREGISLHQVIILASIIEKEAVFDFEKPIIAGVFYNRMEKGMRLRADPTVKYALGDFRKKLLLEELKTSSPYNTYLFPGLPPGPICSPGKESIKAALFPEKVEYLYFVAKGDGTHYFSKSYREHLRAIRIYRRG